MTATAVFHEHSVNFSNETETDGHPTAHPVNAVLQRGDISGDFPNIVVRYARGFGIFIPQEVGKRRLGAFDLTREDRLLPDIHIEKEGRVERSRDPVQST
jgi:hypothetical protein